MGKEIVFDTQLSIVNPINFIEPYLTTYREECRYGQLTSRPSSEALVAISKFRSVYEIQIMKYSEVWFIVHGLQSLMPDYARPLKANPVIHTHLEEPKLPESMPDAVKQMLLPKSGTLRANNYLPSPMDFALHAIKHPHAKDFVLSSRGLTEFFLPIQPQNYGLIIDMDVYAKDGRIKIRADVDALRESVDKYQTYLRNIGASFIIYPKEHLTESMLDQLLAS